MEVLMSDLDISGGGSQPAPTNISVSKMMHVHTIADDTDGVILDEIVSASTATYQEDYIPPASGPNLGAADPNASGQQPSADLSPQGEYINDVKTVLYNLPASMLASLGGGNSLKGLNKLIYAFNHPQAAVDPQVRSIINQIQQQAVQSAQSTLGLPADWQPDPPDTNAADIQMAQDYNNSFEALVYSSGLPKDEADRIVFYHYHPEDMSAGDPLQSQVEKFENLAFASIVKNQGYPANLPKPLDSAQYDTKVAMAYDNAFLKHLKTDPKTQNLTSEEQAELETLHQFPDADVPDKAQLTGLLNQLESEALADVQKQFNLPAGVQPATCFVDFAAMVLANLKTQFNQNVQNFSPPLTPSQQQLLMGTNGVFTANLPQSLQAIFQTIQANSASQIAELLGLPEDWLSATANEAIGDDTTVQEALSEDGEVSGETGVQGDQAMSNQGINAFAKVLGKLLNTQRLGETENAGTVASSSDQVLSAISLAQDALTSINARAAQFAPASSDPYSQDWMGAGSYTALISSCLNNLQQSIFQQEFATGNLTSKVTNMNLEISEIRNAIQDAQESAQNKEQATQKGQKDWSSALTNLANATGNPAIEMLAKIAVDYIKTVMWVADIVTGGLITAICQAAGIEDLAENPLETAGVLNAQQANIMNIVLQVVAMVVECAIGQPELSVESIMNAVKSIATDAMSAVTEFAVTAVNTVLENGLKGAMEIAGNTIKDYAQFAMDSVKSEVMDIVSAIDKALTKDNVLGAFTKVGQGIKDAAAAAKEAVASGVEKLIAGETEIMNTLLDVIERGWNKLKDSLENIKKLLINMLKKPEEYALAWYKLANTSKDVLTGVLTGINDLQTATTDEQQAALTLLIGQFESELTDLNAESKVLNAALQQFFNTIDNLLSWISDVTKQESDLFNKLAIRFIAA